MWRRLHCLMLPWEPYLVHGGHHAKVTRDRSIQEGSFWCPLLAPIFVPFFGTALTKSISGPRKRVHERCLFWGPRWRCAGEAGATSVSVWRPVSEVPGSFQNACKNSKGSSRTCSIKRSQRFETRLALMAGTQNGVHAAAYLQVAYRSHIGRFPP